MVQAVEPVGKGEAVEQQPVREEDTSVEQGATLTPVLGETTNGENEGEGSAEQTQITSRDGSHEPSAPIIPLANSKPAAPATHDVLPSALVDPVHEARAEAARLRHPAPPAHPPSQPNGTRLPMSRYMLSPSRGKTTG